MTINCGSQSNEIRIDNPTVPLGLTDLVVNTLAGDDVVSINRSPVDVTVNGGDGDDFWRIAAGTGAVTIDGGAHLLGDHAIVVVDGKLKNTGSAIIAPGFGGVFYSNLELLEAVPAKKIGKLLRRRSPLP